MFCDGIAPSLFFVRLSVYGVACFCAFYGLHPDSPQRRNDYVGIVWNNEHAEYVDLYKAVFYTKITEFKKYFINNDRQNAR